MAIDLNELATAIGQLTLRFRVRRRLAADWTALNEVLLSAEIGLETDTGKFKFGDGVTPWAGLNYFGGELLEAKNAGANIIIEQFQPTTGGTGGDFASDAHFADRLSVVHFDALNTDGTAIDSGPLGGVVTAVGTGTTLSAVQSKFGGMSSHGDAAGTIDRTGWAITDTGHFDFGAGDFTLEGWFYASGSRGGANILTLFQKNNGTTTSGIGGQGIRVSDDGGGAIAVYLSLSDGTSVAGVFTGDFRTSHTPGSGSWVHVAVVRTTTKVKLYLNGVAAAQTGTDGDATSVTVGTKSILHALDDFNIGASGHLDTATGPGPVNLSTSWRGYIDDVRISKFADYTANFTPPAAQFPGYATPVVNDGSPYPLIINDGVRSIVAGSGMSVDNTDPNNPVISATGGGGGSGGGTVYYPNTIDIPPTTPNAWDDEFNGSTLNSAWSLVNATNGGATCHVTVSNGSVYMQDDSPVSGQVRLLAKAVPSGDFSIAAKLRMHGGMTYNNIGFGLYNSAGPSNWIYRFVSRNDNYPLMTPGWFTFSDPNGVTGPSEGNGPGVWPETVYIRIDKVSGTMKFYISTTGRYWQYVWNFGVPTFDKIVLMYANYGTHGDPQASTLECEWVRRLA